jgi:hypothetical protein
MDQHLKQRVNHYQTLGLRPGARSEEIERAFVRQLSAFTPRPFGSVTAVSIAYETLRDPAKRRAYDQSIGIAPPPPLTRFAVPASGTMSFIGSRDTASRLAALERPSKRPQPPQVEPRPIEPQAVEPKAVEPPPLEPEVVEPEAVESPLVEPDRVSKFLAQSLRLSSREPLVEPPATQAPAAFAFDSNAVESDATSLKPVVLGAVALVGMAALLGAWAGLASIENVVVEDAPAVAEVTADLPPPGPAAAAAAPAPPLIQTQERAAVARPALRSTPPRRAAPAVREEAVSVPEPVTAELAEAPATQAVEAVPAVAARMPLADATVARTIRRIGYPCGSVASTAAGAGAGVFVVTCTSGHSYRAAPVNGRYRFRRL